MSAMISVPFPKSWRGHRVDNISIQEEMLKENQMGDSRIFPRILQIIWWYLAI